MTTEAQVQQWLDEAAVLETRVRLLEARVEEAVAYLDGGHHITFEEQIVLRDGLAAALEPTEKRTYAAQEAR